MDPLSDRLAHHVAGTRESDIRPSGTPTRSVEGFGLDIAGLREGGAGLRRKVAPLTSEQAPLAMRVEEAFSRAARADRRLDGSRPGAAV